MTVRDFLQRFRPAGAPGPAAGAGVPADRVAERMAELGPVFALLAGAEEEAAGIRREATRWAQARRSEATSAAQRQVAEARIQAEAERAAAFTRARVEAEAAGAATVAAAEQEATRIRRRAADRLPRYLALAVDRALADLAPEAPAGACVPAEQ
jgi:hypothetical protein